MYTDNQGEIEVLKMIVNAVKKVCVENELERLSKENITLKSKITELESENEALKLERVYSGCEKQLSIAYLSRENVDLKKTLDDEKIQNEILKDKLIDAEKEIETAVLRERAKNKRR